MSFMLPSNADNRPHKWHIFCDFQMQYPLKIFIQLPEVQITAITHLTLITRFVSF